MALFGWHPPRWSTADLFEGGGMKGWHPPRRAQAASIGDASAYLGALLEGRKIPELPRPPKPPEKTAHPADTESGPDLKLFMALAEFARLTEFKPEAPSEPPARVDIVINGQSHTLQQPADSDIDREAHITRGEMHQAAAKLNELIAQSQDVDGFILDVLSMPVDLFPSTHTLLRAALMCASQVCFKAKDLFHVKRPSQHLNGEFVPILPLPPHSSYPGGHATQAGVVMCVLARLLKEAGRDSARPTGTEQGGAGWQALNTLAENIAKNRQIAGLHYTFDNVDGLKLGLWVGDQFLVIVEDPSSPSPVLKTLWKSAVEEIKPPQ